ncbi:MAG: FtsX-like permease family protein [Pedosphaera sp.]|nr:FtsX-like permease family protein [Pedosphaera sp.]
MPAVFTLLIDSFLAITALGIAAVFLTAFLSAVPVKYNLKSVYIRWRSTLATVVGIGLVVLVFVLLQSLAVGIEKSNASTGDPRNILIARKGATAESSSLVTRAQLRTLQYFEEIERNAEGDPVISADVLVLASLPRIGPSGEANVLLRGVTARGMELRPQVQLVAGRWFSPGRREIVVSRKLAGRFANFKVGDSFKTGPALLTVVGWLDGAGSAYDSECWMDADESRSLFEREMYSTFLVRPKNPEAATNLIRRIENDKRLQLRAESETGYYRKQTLTAAPIKWLAGFLALTMSIGAVFAAMNTMYAAVGARTREIGTLRVLGFHRRNVIVTFLLEGILLAMLGGALGCLISLKWNGYTTATLSIESFSETVFAFTITPVLVGQGMFFAAALGFWGTLLPAVRAARLPIISALKSL